MTKYLVKSVHITYTEVEADSREEAQDIAVGEPFRVESYVEVEEAEEDWV